LAIDRVFTIRGRGTVVTGTLRGAPIARGDVLRVVTAGPGGMSVRVREVQVHGQPVERADPDGRVALNVAGEGAADLERGTVLANEPAVVASDRWLVALRPVADLPDGRRAGRQGSAGGPRRALPADRMPVTVHAGTAHVAAVLGRSGRDLVDLGRGESTAILRLARPLAARAGDRFILRRPSPVQTLAGGRVVDPEPPRGVARRRATPDRIVALAAAVAGSERWHEARLELHGAIAGGQPGVAPDVVAAVDAAILAMVDARPGIRSAEAVRAGAAELRRRVGGSSAVSGDEGSIRMADARLDQLIIAGRLARDGDRIAVPGVIAAGPSPALAAAMDRLVAALSAPNPPSLPAAARAAGCPPEGIRLLEHANRIVRLDDDLAWAFPTWRRLAALALELAETGPLSPAAFRDATGTSRKYVMAILEDLDRRAILRRTPAGHVAGPRAAQFAAELARPDPVVEVGAVPSR
jgi:selenocysteine-specific elongation factor